MKLSAPPPPPPEPEENRNSEPATITPPTDAPVPPPPAKPLAWPAWFASADFLLAALAVALAFLVASFVARNSDIWLHLAAGKRLFAGEYIPGTDPFSYSAADRPWVNHSWLFDAGAYVLYGGKGIVLVLAKASAVALAFVLLIGIRRSGFSLWPWAAVAAVAAIAAAPQMTLRPIIASMLLLAVTLFLLFRLEHRPGSWRFPIAIAITFWLWSNFDDWFLLGPFTLALVLVGELIQKHWLRSADKLDAVEPIGPLPDVPTLAKALAIGVLACMLNPHHVRVWELPFELIGSPEARLDPRLRVVLWKPLDSEYTKLAGLGYNLNGLAYGVLFIGGGVVMGLVSSRLRIALLTLWIGFAVLSLFSLSAIPFFAIVAVPLIASQLNSLSARVQLKSWGDPKTRFILLGSAAGRVACVAAACVACVLTWPGWLQPASSNSAFNRRLGWGVEPDPGLVRAAEQLQAWRDSGQLPPEARGLLASTELANHCAWFAPHEKVYFNGRFNHHRPEIAHYVAVRAGLGLFRQEEEADAKRLEQTLEKIGADYVAITTGPSDGERLQLLSRLASMQMWIDLDQWSPWYLDGRTTICGWRAAPGREKATFDRLRIDPVYLAFGPAVVPLPPGMTSPVPPAVGWEGEFLRGVALPPPGADEALGWLRYKESLRQRQSVLELLARYWWLSTPSPTGMSLLRLTNMAFWPSPPAGPLTDEAAAGTFLALRAARRAIAANPDHPDGYFALGLVLGEPSLPMSESDRILAQITAFRQCLVRMPTPENFKPGTFAASPTEAAAQLAQLHLGRQISATQYAGIPIDTLALSPLLANDATGFLFEINGQPRLITPLELSQQPPSVQNEVRRAGRPHLLALDLGREYLVLANQYAALEWNNLGDQVKMQVDRLKDWLKRVESEVVKANTTYVRASGQMKVRDQVRTALRNNLVGEALRILNDKDTDLARDFGPDMLEVANLALQQAALELALGRLEDVGDRIDFASARIELASARPESRILAQALQGIIYEKLLFEGNYAEAGKLMERLEGGSLDADPAKSLRDKFDPRFFVQLKDRLVTWIYAAQFLALLSPTQFDLVIRGGTPEAALGTYGQDASGNPHPGFLFLQQNLANRRAREAEFFFRRGLLSLMEGDIATARTRFLATRQPAIPEWGLPEFTNPTAELYLRLINQAAKKGK